MPIGLKYIADACSGGSNTMLSVMLAADRVEVDEPHQGAGIGIGILPGWAPPEPWKTWTLTTRGQVEFEIWFRQRTTDRIAGFDARNRFSRRSRWWCFSRRVSTEQTGNGVVAAKPYFMGTLAQNGHGYN